MIWFIWDSERLSHLMIRFSINSPPYQMIRKL
nr:MAG TPA: hypothetical protein [Bacteriophage sp.]